MTLLGNSFLKGTSIFEGKKEGKLDWKVNK